MEKIIRHLAASREKYSFVSYIYYSYVLCYSIHLKFNNRYKFKQTLLYNNRNKNSLLLFVLKMCTALFYDVFFAWMYKQHYKKD